MLWFYIVIIGLNQVQCKVSRMNHETGNAPIEEMIYFLCRARQSSVRTPMMTPSLMHSSPAVAPLLLNQVVSLIVIFISFSYKKGENKVWSTS